MRRPLSSLVGVGSSSGQIAVRNAEQKSVAFSSSLAETLPRVLSLQRDFLRSVPWIKRAYGVQMPESVRAHSPHALSLRMRSLPTPVPLTAPSRQHCNSLPHCTDAPVCIHLVSAGDAFAAYRSLPGKEGSHRGARGQPHDRSGSDGT